MVLFSKILKFFMVVFLLLSVTVFSQPAEAASTKYNHKHTGYTCYKLSYYVTPAKCKALKKQTKQLDKLSLISDAIGLSGLTADILALVFGSAVSANAIFVKAANQGKGVQLNYISHFSNLTTDVYSSDQKYVIK